MTWIVTWLLTQMLIVSCPQDSDPYGRISQWTTTMACYETTFESRREFFVTRNEAEDFIKQGKVSCSECSNWEMRDITELSSR